MPDDEPVQKCESCWYWATWPRKLFGEPKGYCRSTPPTKNVFMGVSTLTGTHVVTRASDWCGDWVNKDNPDD